MFIVEMWMPNAERWHCRFSTFNMDEALSYARQAVERGDNVIILQPGSETPSLTGAREVTK